MEMVENSVTFQAIAHKFKFWTVFGEMDSGAKIWESGLVKKMSNERTEKAKDIDEIGWKWVSKYIGKKEN